MSEETNLREEVEHSLTAIRPALQRDGGDVELVDVSEDGIVSVRLQGACRGCPASQMTLKFGIERLLKQQIPAVKGVEAV
jgi:Fe-S cluster biogenesis protein NfuA